MILRLLGVTEEKSGQISSLSYAARLRVLLGYLGKFLFILAALSLVPAAVSIAAREFFISLRYAVVLVGLTGVGAVMVWAGRDGQLQLNESMVLSALMFSIAPIVMAFTMSASGLAPLDAVFEAVSATTTTGLSTVASVEDKPTTFLFSRAWMQWYGGLGIVFVSLALVIRPGLSAKRLAGEAEESEDLIGSTRAHARWVLIVYGVLTLLGIAMVWILGSTGFFDSVVYVFSAVSTGGFSPHDASLAALPDRLTPLLITVVSVAGAVSMVTYRRMYRESPGALVRDRQVHILVALSVLVSAGLFLLADTELTLDVGDRLLNGFLMGLSAQSTTGFATVDLDTFSNAGLLLLGGAMIVGGCVGSTAGGFKIFRLMITVRLILYMIVRTALPRDAVVQPRLGNRRLDPSDIQNAVAIVLLFVGVIGASWFVFLLWGHEPLPALVEVVSATGTVGLSSGITSPDLDPVLKGVLCIDMLMGRLEILAWIVLFSPVTWIGTRRGTTSK